MMIGRLFSSEKIPKMDFVLMWHISLRHNQSTVIGGDGLIKMYDAPFVRAWWHRFLDQVHQEFKLPFSMNLTYFVGYLQHFYIHRCCVITPRGVFVWGTH